jgi:hypothetical protein
VNGPSVLARARAPRARHELVVLLPLLASVLLIYGYRDQLVPQARDTGVRP